MQPGMILTPFTLCATKDTCCRSRPGACPLA
jgi:hypothetical protein